jgi:hypothetical protein
MAEDHAYNCYRCRAEVDGRLHSQWSHTDRRHVAFWALLMTEIEFGGLLRQWKGWSRKRWVVQSKN